MTGDRIDRCRGCVREYTELHAQENHHAVWLILLHLSHREFTRRGIAWLANLLKDKVMVEQACMLIRSVPITRRLCDAGTSSSRVVPFVGIHSSLLETVSRPGYLPRSSCGQTKPLLQLWADQIPSHDPTREDTSTWKWGTLKVEMWSRVRVATAERHTAFSM